MMKNYLLLFTLMIFGCSIIQAQKQDVLCGQLQEFVKSKKDVPSPQETDLALNYLNDLIAEGESFSVQEKKRKLKATIKNIRSQYWETQFRLTNAAAMSSNDNFCFDNKGNSRLSPIKNPDLKKDCELNIAVVVDQSGSLDTQEKSDIKDALETLVSSMTGSGNLVQLFGMGNNNVSEVSISSSVLYGSGVMGEDHLDWINNDDTGLFSGSGNSDGWFTGLEAVNDEMPDVDLVIVISDGSNNDSPENIAAGNVLKDNGAHIFVLGMRIGNYAYSGNTGNDDLSAFLNHDIMPDPVAASFPSISEISSKDYHPFIDFSTLSDWMVDMDFIFVNNGTFSNPPECSSEGIPFSITYQMDDEYNPALFSTLSSGSSDYTINNYVFGENNFGTTITFNITSNTCTCEGTPIIIKLKQKGCPEVKYLISEVIPCCVKECSGLDVYKWKVKDCVIYNGQLARPFSVYVNSPGQTLTNVLGEDDLTPCASTLEGITYTQTGSTSFIQGFIVFTDDNCTENANVSLALEFDEKKCCTIGKDFILKACDISEKCTEDPPAAIFIYSNANGNYLHVEVNLPLNTVVGLTSYPFGPSSFAVVSEIACGTGSSLCNGIAIPINSNVECGEGMSWEYIYEITFNKCIWYVAGDYCDLPEYACQANAQMLIGSAQSPSVAIAVNHPIGTILSVIDNMTGTTGNFEVQNISCGPFQLNPSGGVSGGTPCSGILVPVGYALDCNTQSNDYNFSIGGIDCIAAGDYCDLPTIFFQGGFNGDGSEGRLTQENSNALINENRFKVFPNPVAQNSDLNFDFTALKNPISYIEIIGAGMNQVAYLTADQISARMNYNFSSEFSSGIYFISVHLDNGEILREKIVLLGRK